MTVRAMTIAVVLLAPLASLALTGASRQPDDEGKTLYGKNCLQCHGVRGTPPKGMKSAYPNIPTFDAAFIAHRSDDSVVKILTRGKNSMPSFKGKVTPAEMATLAKYVRGLASK